MTRHLTSRCCRDGKGGGWRAISLQCDTEIFYKEQASSHYTPKLHKWPHDVQFMPWSPPGHCQSSSLLCHRSTLLLPGATTCSSNTENPSRLAPVSTLRSPAQSPLSWKSTLVKAACPPGPQELVLYEHLSSPSSESLGEVLGRTTDEEKPVHQNKMCHGR